MRLYVSVPCYGSVITVRTVASLMNALPRALQEGVLEDYEINFHGEALINRCRNIHANLALKKKYDKILHIDSDIEFTYNDFLRLVQSPHPFIGGSYPLKCMPPVVNFNPLPGKGTELLKTNRGYDYQAFEEYKKKYVGPDGVVEVRDVPTGFLCVSMDVYKKITEIADIYGDFYQETGQREGYFDFYPTKVIDRELVSEDWGLAYLARKSGFKIMFDTKVITAHMGNHMYRMNQVYGEIDQNPIISENKA